MKKLTFLFCFFIFVTSQVYSQYLPIDNFSYSIGNLNGQGGWTALTGTPPIQVTAPGLTYSDLNGSPYQGSGVGNAAMVGATGESDVKLFTSPATNGSVYSSFMLNVTAVQGWPRGDYFFTLMDSSGENCSRLYVRPGEVSGKYQFGLLAVAVNSPPIVNWTDNLDEFLLGTTYLIVVEYNRSCCPTNDVMNLYVFSSTDVVPSSPPTPTEGPQECQFCNEPDSLNRVQLRQGSSVNSPSVIIDGIYISDSWDASVLPVELSAFTSTVSNREVTLNWTTQSEINNSGFEIERAVNGVWTSAGYIAGHGNSTVSHNYTFTDRNLNTGRYNYRLKQIDYNGSFEYHTLNNEVIIGTPGAYALSQNFPNPFNPSTKINYDLPFDGKISINVFDVSGKEVATLVNDVMTAGYHTLSFNASNLSSGVYFYKITADAYNGQHFFSIKKMTLIK